MPGPPERSDIACVIHLHSTYSDGTGTVPEIAAAARDAGVDAVLLTDHDTLAAKEHGEEGWHGSVLVLVGEEVSPPNKNHFLAFDVEKVLPRKGVGPPEICANVAEAGGFGFAAHPFSRGSERFPQYARGFPWTDLDCDGLAGIELWSYFNDTGERLSAISEVVRFVARPERFVDHPPPENLAAWDRLTRDRQVAAIGGLDAHQFGIRRRGHVLRAMGYRRSFRLLRTHALCERPLRGELEPDREAIYGALREGRCYLAMDALGPAGGFGFWAEGNERAVEMGEEAPAGDYVLRARLAQRATLRLIRDGELVSSTDGASDLEHRASEPGVYRLEAWLHAFGRERTWVISNPIYLR
jgi:hypothetical protein